MTGHISNCCVPKCKAGLNLLYSFPAEKPLFEEWKRRIRNPNFWFISDEVIRKNYKVCDDHFNEFNRYPCHYEHQRESKLIFCSVPTVNIPGKKSTLNDSCAICTSATEYLISVDQSEGRQNDLYEKINRYLPIQANHEDMICFPCATTLISFDKLYTSCKKAYGISTDDEENSLTEKNSQSKPEESCVTETTYGYEENNEDNILKVVQEDLNEQILKRLSVVQEDLNEQILKGLSVVQENLNKQILKGLSVFQEDLNEQILKGLSVVQEDLNEQNLKGLSVVQEDLNEQGLSVVQDDLNEQNLNGLSVVQEDFNEQGLSVVQEDFNEQGLSVVQEDLNEEILKKSNDGKLLEVEVYDEDLKNALCIAGGKKMKTKPIKQISPPVNRCSYKWNEINNMLRSNSLRSYTCHLCCVCFPNVQELLEHFKDCSQNVCRRCLKVVDSGEIMVNHLKSCKTYSCYLCPTEFKQNSVLINHFQNHSTSICDLCHQMFDNDLQCEKHKLDKHEFTCEQCNNSFESSLERLQYRNTILPNTRLLCLSCYGIYHCIPKEQETSINHVKDNPIAMETNVDELRTSREDPIMLDGMDVTINTSDLECPDIYEACGITYYEVQTANDLTVPSENTRRVADDLNDPSHNNRRVANYLKDHLYFKTEGLLSCKHCSKMFASDKYLQVHMSRSHSNVSNFNCNFEYCRVCAKKFQSKKEYIFHWKWRCVLKCGDCGKKLRGSESMKAHAKLHLNQHYTCHDCGKEYHRKGNLVHHIKSRHKQVDLVCCSACGILVNRYKYSAHMRKHRQKPPKECYVCLEKFKTRKQLSVHFLTHNPVRAKPPTECRVCLKKFKTKKILSVHYLTHNPVRPFTCSMCPSIYKSVIYLRKHMRRCHSPTRNACRFCVQVFQSVEQFNEHFADKHKSFSKFTLLDNGKGYHCSHCLKIFDSSKAMFAHSKEMDKEYRNTKKRKRVEKYEQISITKLTCTDCKRNFATKQNLLNHIQWIHNSEQREFQCSYCPSKFKRKDAKIGHERIHTNERPYSCSMCDKKFRQKTDMRRHEVASHLQKMPLPIKEEEVIKVKTKNIAEGSYEEFGDNMLLQWPAEEDY